MAIKRLQFKLLLLSRKLSSGDEISATIVQSLDVRITYAPSVLATRSGNQVSLIAPLCLVDIDMDYGA